jgi:hypothetical protein
MINEMNENELYSIDLQFIPPVNWFKISIKGKYIIFNSFEKWKKMSFGNRCTLLGGNGLVNLSVPIEKGRDQKGLLHDIKISYLDNWQLKFWRTIISCYNRAPFFEYYKDDFEKILFKKHELLVDLNLELVLLCFKYLDVNKEVIMDDEHKYPHLDATDHFLTPKLFQQDPHPITYHQMFGDRFGFNPNLSIMDLLFMEGPEAKYLLSK